MIRTPEDIFGNKAVLGSFDGKAMPIKVNENGVLQVIDGACQKYELVQTLVLDLSEARLKEPVAIAFDSFAVVNLKGSFFMYIGDCQEKCKCTINKTLSVAVSANKFYITNEAQDGNAEIWLFRIKED